jgi:hypothetical protein
MNAKPLIALAAAVLGLGLLSAPATAAPPVTSTPHFYTVDVGAKIPGATDTFVASLAPAGSTAIPQYVIVGSYLDSIGHRNGFIAHLANNYTLIDATAMAAPAGSSNTNPTSVRSDGTSVGFYVDPVSSVSYGFLRDPAGNLTVGLAASGADTSWTFSDISPPPPTYGDPKLLGTFPMQITSSGLITGFYTVTAIPGNAGSTVSHGFTWQNGVFTAPTDQPGTTSTSLFGVTPAGKQYGDVTTAPTAKDAHGTGKGLTIRTTRKGVTHYRNYVDTAVTEKLPVGACGWTSVTGATDTGVLVGDAGNGCATYGYAWTWRGGKFTNFVAKDPANTPAVETIVTGITPTGIITGGYETNWSMPPGGWLSPSDWYLDPNGLHRSAFGYWHGFIQTPN